MGFTAYASQTRTFLAGDVVIFDVAISNFGGHYDPTTSTFYCPYHAVYMVNINLAAGDNERLGGIIHKDGSYIGEAVAHFITEVIPTASAFVITECEPNQVIWIMSDANNNVMLSSNSDRRSLFSVFLLQKIE